MMTYDMFFEMLEEKVIYDDLIVRLRCRMKCEAWKEFNEVLIFNGDRMAHEWLNDWDEGWDDKEVVGYVTLDHVFDRLKEERMQKDKVEARCRMMSYDMFRELWGDCISRQATLKPYKGLNDEDTISVWLIRKNIEQQPPVTPKTRWIPVSERLPEENGRYLCTYNDNLDPSFCIDFGSYKNGEWYASGVIAWMPLPQPYKTESEDTTK